MTQLFYVTTLLFFFWIGYKHGRRVEKWSQNHENKNNN